MSRFLKRRIQNLAILAISLCAIGYWGWRVERTLGHGAYQTGYALYGAVIVLAAYNARKKFPSLPLGTSRSWLQLHIYLGLGSAFVFALHAGWHWPSGWVETLLAAIYVATFLSGLWGLYLTRTIPRQLARTSEQFIFERIPSLRREVLERSRAVVLVGVEESGATTLADFYLQRIDAFLSSTHGMRYWVRPTSAVRRKMMRELTDIKRFLTETESAACEKLFSLIRKKDDLDFHEARQGLLKAWLFVHIAFTYALLMVATLHGLLALAMRGGPI